MKKIIFLLVFLFGCSNLEFVYNTESDSKSLLKGKWTGWDHQPFVDATKAYVRGAVDPNTTATKAKKRFPFVETVEPHNPRKK